SRDWSSDVCSSDLHLEASAAQPLAHVGAHAPEADESEVHGSARESDGHEEVAIAAVIVTVELSLTRELDRLVGVSEGETHERRVECAETVKQVLRVERDGDVLSLELGLDRLRGLGIVTLTGVEHDLALGEAE